MLDVADSGLFRDVGALFVVLGLAHDRCLGNMSPFTYYGASVVDELHFHFLQSLIHKL